MLKQTPEFNSKILKIALNLGESQIIIAIAKSYKVIVSKKILIKAIKENQFEFIKELWVNGHNIKQFKVSESSKL